MQVKKILATTGAMIAIVAPTLTVISCTHDNLKPGIYLLIDGPDHSQKDKSFNEQGYNGIQEYFNSLDQKNIDHEQKTPYVSRPTGPGDQDFRQMYASVPKNSTLVTTGFVQRSPLQAAKEELQDKKVIYLDGKIENYANIASVEFKVEQAAYLGGYALAQYAATDQGYNDLKAANGSTNDNTSMVTISTYGGTDIPTVTGFMGGFKYGILDALNVIQKDLTNYPHAHNIEFKTFNNVQEHYSGTYAAGDGKAITDKFRAAGIDVILPVAGPQTADTLNNFSGKVIGVDSKQEDIYDTKYKNRFLFSILKDLKTATTNMLNLLNGYEAPANYLGLGKVTIGDITNDLVGISNNTLAISNFYDKAKEDPNLIARAQAIDPNWFFDYNSNWFSA